ncbi:uncharacterized protein LOC144173950 isoform X3 [Haemaphysalis longicornis]
MDVYEEEFGDLLVVNTRRTVQQQFYGDTMKRLVRLYSFLPAELLECRMQKYWEKFLERNPNLRKKHKAEMKAIRALCPSANLSKVPQRKSLKRLGANLRRARAPQQAAKRTSGGSNAQANLSRPQNGRKGVVEQRYMPLDIRVTRSPPATVEPDKLSMAANQAAEEPEEAEEKRMNENLPAVSEMTATKTGNAPRQDDARPDIVAHFEENKLSLAAGTEGDTKHATSSWSPTHRVHNAAHDGPLNVQANASILEPLQQQRGTAGEHAPEGRAHDDTESDSEYGEFPPLMSRMQVAASDAASDDEYEHALDDDFPPLETP